MLDALTLDQIRTFVAVAEAGSFRGAGIQLSRAQSAISHAIANLEAELGILLFDRSLHRPVLTKEGRALLQDGRSLLLRADLLRAKAQGMGSGVEIELAIVVDTLFPVAIVVEALKTVHKTFPTVGVRLRIGTLGEPVEALGNRQADLAITVGEDIREARVDFESLLRLSVVAVTAPSHPLAATSASAGIGAAELSDHLQIVVEDPSALSKGRDFGVLSPRTWRVRDQATKRDLIRAGIGWGRLPLWAARRDLDEGRLERLPTAALGREGETFGWAYLARRLDQPLGPAAALLRSSLLEIIAARDFAI